MASTVIDRRLVGLTLTRKARQVTYSHPNKTEIISRYELYRWRRFGSVNQPESVHFRPVDVRCRFSCEQNLRRMMTASKLSPSGGTTSILLTCNLRLDDDIGSSSSIIISFGPLINLFIYSFCIADADAAAPAAPTFIGRNQPSIRLFVWPIRARHSLGFSSWNLPLVLLFCCSHTKKKKMEKKRQPNINNDQRH